jgi:hypothetical protein
LDATQNGDITSSSSSSSSSKKNSKNDKGRLSHTPSRQRTNKGSGSRVKELRPADAIYSSFGVGAFQYHQDELYYAPNEIVHNAATSTLSQVPCCKKTNGLFE